MKFKATLFICNKPNHNNRVYLEEDLNPTLRKIIEDKNNGKPFVCSMEPMNTYKELDIVNTSHQLFDIRREEHLGEVRYVGTFETLDTPVGKVLEQMIKDNVELSIATVGSGIIEKLEKDVFNDEGKVQQQINNLNSVILVKDYVLTDIVIIPTDDHNREYKIEVIDEN